MPESKYDPAPSDINPLAYFKPGAFKAKADRRDVLVTAAPPVTLPRRTVLPETPITSQGAWGSCTAHAAGRMARGEFLTAGQAYDPSEEFLYVRLLEEMRTMCTDGSSGTNPSHAADVYKRLGVPVEAVRPYMSKGLCIATSQEEITQAAAWKIWRYTKAATLDAIKTALHQGHRVNLAMVLFQDFVADRSTGLIRNSPASGQWGGHAMCIEGYDDDRHGGALKIANSWSTSWGAQGYGWLRYTDANAPEEQGGFWRSEAVVYEAAAMEPEPEPEPEPERGPVIHTMTPVSGPVGEAVTLTIIGARFGADSAVWFGYRNDGIVVERESSGRLRARIPATLIPVPAPYAVIVISGGKQSPDAIWTATAPGPEPEPEPDRDAWRAMAHRAIDAYQGV